MKSSAEEKIYQLSLRIRAVGDKEKQDLNVYLFQKNVDIPVTKTMSITKIGLIVGSIFVLLLVGYYIYNKHIKKK